MDRAGLLGENNLSRLSKRNGPGGLGVGVGGREPVDDGERWLSMDRINTCAPPVCDMMARSQFQYVERFEDKARKGVRRGGLIDSSRSMTSSD